MKIKKLIVRASRAVSIFMATIICLSLLPSFNLRAEMLSNIFTYNNYNIEYNVVNEWEGYQNIEIKLTNTGSEPIYNWALGYNAGGEIINTWNSTVYSNSGTDYIIKNAVYNYEVMPNESITFGYTLIGNNLTIPSSFENCTERIEISDKYDAQLIITDKWDVGFTGYIEITNVSDVPLEAWMLSFDTNFTIGDFWNANIVENDEYSYIASSKIMSNPIQPQDSVQIGILASFENEAEPIITNVIMSSVQIKNSISSDKNNDGNIIDDSDNLVGKMYFKDLSSEDDLIYDLDGNCYFKNQILLTAYDGVSFETVSALADSVNARIVGYIELTNDYQIEFNYDMSIDELFGMVSELSVNSIIELASPNIAFEIKCDSLTNDTQIQPDEGVMINEKNWNLFAINATYAWGIYDNLNYTTPVKIGVIDAMFFKHYDLHFEKIWNNPNPNPNNKNDHGNLVSGIIGAEYNNRIGIAGICPKTKLYGFSYEGKYASEQLNLSTTMLFKYGLALMIGNNVKIINCSLSTDSAIINSESIEKTLYNLLKKGYDFLIVTSAGNKSTEAVNNNFFTNIDSSSQLYNNIIVVGAVDHKKINEFSEDFARNLTNGNVTLEYNFRKNSNYGNRVDILAPGEKIVSTYIEKDDYKYFYDTSAAAPQVSGVAGMIYSINPDLKGNEVKSIIINSAKESANKDSKRLIKCNKGQGYEYALLDAKAAVDMALSIYGPFQPTFDKNEAIIFGTVTDENDEPVGYAKIIARYKEDNAYIVKEATETDDDGTYTFTLPLGTYDIEFYTGDKPALSNLFQGENYKYHLIKDKLIERDVDGKIQAYPLNVKLDNLKIKSIGVFDSNGKDLSEVTVTLTNSSNSETYTAIVNSDNFLYGDFYNGEYTISVSKSGYITNTLQVKAKDGFIYDEDGNLLEKILLTPIKSYVTGKVTEYNKTKKTTKPLGGVNVSIYKDDSIIASANTKSDGTYRIELNRQGDFIVKFSEKNQKPIHINNGEYVVDAVFEVEDNEYLDIGENEKINITLNGDGSSNFTGDYSGDLLNGIWLHTFTGINDYYVHVYITPTTGEYTSMFVAAGGGLYTNRYHHWKHELKMATYTTDGTLIKEQTLKNYYEDIYIDVPKGYLEPTSSTPLMQTNSINSIVISNTGITYNVHIDGYYVGIRKENWTRDEKNSINFYNNSKVNGIITKQPF